RKKDEQGNSPADFFVRRTGSIYFDIESVQREWKHAIEFMAVYLNWNEMQTENYEAEILHEIKTHRNIEHTD
ncbi:MAG: hypothetical protein IAF38_10350, partial [Bacteroidia bacterium]|nr:hypothetical protein [Bacteroidia bacterium]